MPSSSVSFPLTLARNLEVLRDQVGLTQKQLAKAANVAQGTYSNLILGKAVRAKSARAIVAAIQQAVEHHIRHTNRTPQEAEDLLHDVARAVAVLEGGRATGISEGPAHRIKALDRLAQHQPPELIKIHQPGGSVPSDAVPYVQRLDDQGVIATLGQMPFQLIVRGPIQSGKSTVLALLERRARQMGIETAWFDPRPPSTDAAKNARYDEDGEADATLAVSELLQAKWNLDRPRRGTIDTLPKLYNWLSDELAQTSERPRVLILDDLVTLGGVAAERWLNLFVRPMVNERANRGVNVSIAVGLSHHFGEYFARQLIRISSVVHWKPRLEATWLKPHEVGELLHNLRIAQATDLQSDSDADDLFDVFRGQPYLTHAAAASRDFLTLVKSWRHSRSPKDGDEIRQFQCYKQHLNAIRLMLCGPTFKADRAASRLIASYRDLSTHTDSQSSPPIDPDHLLFFKTAKLLNDLAQPALDIYRLVAEDLKSSLT